MKPSTMSSAIVSVFVCIFASLLIQPCSSEAIDELEYSKMPKVFTLDDYGDCLRTSSGLYCVADIQLKTSAPSDLWYQIKNFSSNSLKHYRHDILHKGICLTKRCNVTEENSLVLRVNRELAKKALTTCMNKELDEMYKLQGDITIRYCEHKDKKKEFDNKDWFFIGIVFIIFLMNIFGTAYHIKTDKDKSKQNNRFLMSLSVVANWKKIMSKSATEASPEEKRKCTLAGIQGMRFLTMFGVIFSHVLLIVPYGFVENTSRVESPYDDPLMHLLYNGSLVVQTFFLMGSFLMAYNFLVYVEKHPIQNMWTYFLIIFQRWIRLTPVYALIIGYVCTIYEKGGTGPLWQYVIGDDADSCRRWWWTNLLYINNYIGEGQLCLGVTWYLAVDTQLFCYGILVMMVIWKFPSLKRILLASLVIISILVPGIMTYRNGYYPIVPQGPESFRVLYQDNPTFKYIYTTVAGNIAGYTVGIISGCIHYYLEKNNISLADKKWYIVFYYVAFPLGVGVVFTGVYFYKDDYVYDPLTAAIYAAVYKFIFAIIVTSIMLGIFHKCDNIIRGMVEWGGYQILGRLTYCAYLVHTIPQRLIVGSLIHPFHLTEYNAICMFLASITMTYVISMVLCIFVEIPFTNMQKMIFQSGPKKEITLGKKDVECEKKENDATTQVELNKIENGESSVSIPSVKVETVEVEINKCEDCSKL